MSDNYCCNEVDAAANCFQWKNKMCKIPHTFDANVKISWQN
jgi:hypothetical protein